MKEQDDYVELKKKLEILELQNRKLQENQVKLGEVTNNYLMLHYLNKNIHECKTSQKLWETYLHNVSDYGFNYDNVYLIIPTQANYGKERYETKLLLENDSLKIENVTAEELLEHIKNAINEKKTVMDSENRAAAVPIINLGGEIKGILVINKEAGISYEEIELLELYAQQTVSTIDNVMLNEKLMENQTMLGEKINQFVMLHYVSKEIHDSKQYYEVIEKYLRAITSELGFNFKKGVLYIVDENDRGKIQQVTIENEKLCFKDISDIENYLVVETLKSGSRNISDDENEVVFPIISFSKVRAAIEIENDRPISSEEVQMLEIFALQTATMLDNTKLNFNLRNEVKKRTQELQEAYENLKKIDKLKDEFLAMVSHELRTPLTSIMAYLETIIIGIENKDMDIESQEEFIKIIYSEAENLKNIIDSVIEMSKLEAGKTEFYIEKADIIEIYKKAVNKLREQLKNKEIKLNEKIDFECTMAEVDRQQFYKVIWNVLSNAIKYSHKGGEIEVETKKVGDSLILSVKDYGIGIDEKNFQRVFSRFEVIEEMEHHSKGIGLGMPSSKLIIEKMGGKIWFESKVGEGSKFFIKLKI